MKLNLILIGLIAILFFGCTGNQKPLPNQNMSCIDYCKNQPHVQCVGEWKISGTYPNCGCNFVCNETTSPPQNNSTTSQNNSISWLNETIKKTEMDPVSNPPSSIYKCNYNNQTVYYMPPKCCDMYSDLFLENGTKICSPDGGITGRGDGLCSDFNQSSCVLVWKDSRTK